MTWIDTINELQYYNQPKGLPCYCDIIVFPADLMLQGSFGTGSGSYTLLVEVMKADGTQMYENATSYFEYYFAVNSFTGQHFFNARLKAFAPSMCTHACYILHVKVTDGSTVIFDKYTERYCQSSCCDLARDINIAQGSVITGGTDDSTFTSTTTPVNLKLTECGDALITLRSRFDCFDKFTGNYYGIPSGTLSGSASFAYQIVTNMRGRIVRRPREVKREYSYNCRLQHVESTSVYLLEGFEYFPTWKMQEIEAQLHSTEIYVEDRRYEFDGGTPFRQVHQCTELFKLETSLNDCTVRQVFGCSTGCEEEINFDGAAKMFVVPEGYEGTGFYNENKQFVAADYDELLNYFRNLNGMAAVNDIDVSSLGCVVYKAFSISGTAYIPTSFYHDKAAAINRIYGLVLPAIEDICSLFGNACVKPVIVTDDITVEAVICVAPETETYVIENMESSDIAIGGYGNWSITEPDTAASLYNGQVTMSLYVFNDELPEDPEEPGVPAMIPGNIISVISAYGRPVVQVVLDSSNNDLPEDVTIIIQTNGLVKYYGPATASDSTGSFIELDNLVYNIN